MTGEIGGVSAEETLRNMAGVFDTNGLDFGSRQPPCIVFVTPVAKTQNKENFDTMFSPAERRKIAGFLSARYQSAEKEGKLRLVPVIFTCSDLVEIGPFFSHSRVGSFSGFVRFNKCCTWRESRGTVRSRSWSESATDNTFLTLPRESSES